MERLHNRTIISVFCLLSIQSMLHAMEHKGINISYDSINSCGHPETKSVKISPNTVQLVKTYQDCKQQRDTVYQDSDTHKNTREAFKKTSVLMGILCPIATIHTLTHNQTDGHVPGFSFFLGSIGSGILAIKEHKKYSIAWNKAQKNTELPSAFNLLKQQLSKNTSISQEKPLIRLLENQHKNLINSTRKQPFFDGSCCEPENNGSQEGQKMFALVLNELKK